MQPSDTLQNEPHHHLPPDEQVPQNRHSVQFSWQQAKARHPEISRARTQHVDVSYPKVCKQQLPTKLWKNSPLPSAAPPGMHGGASPRSLAHDLPTNSCHGRVRTQIRNVTYRVVAPPLDLTLQAKSQLHVLLPYSNRLLRRNDISLKCSRIFPANAAPTFVSA